MKTIALPENTLVVLCGVAGCGKSSFAARHFLPSQIVSSDECRARLSDDEANQSVTGHAFELWRFIIRKRLLLGRFTIADATNLERGDRRWLINTAHQYGFQAAAILFDLPLELALSRNVARARVVPEDAVIRQYELFQETLRSIRREGFDFVYILNEKDQNSATVRIDNSA